MFFKHGIGSMPVEKDKKQQKEENRIRKQKSRRNAQDLDFNCTFCSITFSFKENLYRHLTDYHRIPRKVHGKSLDIPKMLSGVQRIE